MKQSKHPSLGEDFGDVPLLESLLVLGSLSSLSSNKSMFSPLTRKKRGGSGHFLACKAKETEAVGHSAGALGCCVQRWGSALSGCLAYSRLHCLVGALHGTVTA